MDAKKTVDQAAAEYKIPATKYTGYVVTIRHGGDAPPDCVR